MQETGPCLTGECPLSWALIMIESLRDANIQHVVDGRAVPDGQIRHMEAAPGIPAHLQLLPGPVQQIVERLIVDLAVGRPAAAEAYRLA